MAVCTAGPGAHHVGLGRAVTVHRQQNELAVRIIGANQARQVRDLNRRDLALQDHYRAVVATDPVAFNVRGSDTEGSHPQPAAGIRVTLTGFGGESGSEAVSAEE